MVGFTRALRVSVLFFLSSSLFLITAAEAGGKKPPPPPPRCPTSPLVIVTCGNAFAACNSGGEVGQMQAALAGLGVQVVAHNYTAGKYPAPMLDLVSVLRRAQCGTRPIFLAGRSAGAWETLIAGLVGAESGLRVAGLISYYAPTDLATLWQRSEWGALHSPRGPILLLMPWGLRGCSNCDNPFPAGDSWFFDVNNDADPRNDPRMIQALEASPIHYFAPNSPPLFLTQGTEDGIIGQYGGVSQAERMYDRQGGRPEDALVVCPGYAHGYAYQAACPVNALRNWFIHTLGR